MNKKFISIKDINGLINALQLHLKKYGNLPVCIDLSVSKDEGRYDVDAVLYSTNEDNEKTIDLIVW
jgi:hypothetical protein